MDHTYILILTLLTNNERPVVTTISNLSEIAANQIKSKWCKDIRDISEKTGSAHYHTSAVIVRN